MQARRKRLGSALMALLLALGLCTPMAGLIPRARAAGTPKPAAPALDGFLVPVSQTSVVPAGYTAIDSVDDLLAIPEDPDGSYILMADLDLSGYNWKPRCTASDTAFRGVFDGNGHVISNLNGSNGLFGYVIGGEIRDVGLENASISAYYEYYESSIIGGIAAHCSSTTISNCYFQGDIDTNAYTVGGIVGLAEGLNPSVEYCWMEGSIRSTNLAIYDYHSSSLGGIVGESGAFSGLTIHGCIHSGSIVTERRAMFMGGIGGAVQGTISNCQNYGSITHYTRSAYIGGITSGTRDCVVESCMNAADISYVIASDQYSSEPYIGGITALQADVRNCFNCGDITVDGGDGDGYVGGITGEEGYAENSYNVGTVSAPGVASAGALFGSVDGTSRNCYYRSDGMPVYGTIHNTPTLDNVTALTASQMGSAASFGGFDFGSVWTMGSGGYPYPVLQSMYETPSGSDDPSGSDNPNAIIPTPNLQSVSNRQGGVLVEWSVPLETPDQPHKVDGYYVLRGTGSGSYERIADVDGFITWSYVDASAVDGQTYTYTVQAHYQGQTGSYDAQGLTITRDQTDYLPNAITGVTIELGDQPTTSGLSYTPIQNLWLTTGSQGMRVTLRLEDPLDGDFTGRITLSHGDKQVYECGYEDVTYDAEDRTLVFPLVLTGGDHLTPDTAYTITVEDQYGNQLASAQARSVPEEYQFWGFTNRSGLTYTLEDLERYYPASIAKNLYDMDKAYGDQGASGLCFGMALAAGLHMTGAMDGVGIQGSDILNTVTDPDTPLTGDWAGFTVRDYLAACNVLQNSAEYQDQRRAHMNDYEGLFQTLSAGEPVVVSTWIEYEVTNSAGKAEKELVSHAALAYDIEWDAASATLRLYDPQTAPYQLSTMKLYRYNGEWRAWDYSRLGATFSSTDHDEDGMYFSYRPLDLSPDAEFDVDWTIVNEGKNFLDSADNFLNNLLSSAGLAVVPIAGASGGDTGYAWVSGSGTVELAGLTDTFTVADSRGSYTAGAGALTLGLDGGVSSLALSGTGELSLAWEQETDTGTVTGTFTGRSDGAVTLTREGDKLRLAGADSGSFSVTGPDGISFGGSIKEGEELVIDSEGTVEQDGGTPGVFSDVAPDSWYADAVAWAVERGITTGTSATTFSPDRPCTRAEIVTLIWRTLGLDELTAPTGDNPFRDVDEDAYYYHAILWAAQNGITTGTGPDTFSPNAVCSRGEVVTFLWRVDFPPKRLPGNPGFDDVFQWDYYWYPVLWAVDRGITTGTSENTFSPADLCTRAQVVTFLYRDFNDDV